METPGAHPAFSFMAKIPSHVARLKAFDMKPGT
jgi:hypothetical protein